MARKNDADRIAEKVEQLRTILAFAGFNYDDAKSDQKWSDVWGPVAEMGFARVAVEEDDESFDVFRFTPNGCLMWSLTGIQFTSVPAAMIKAIILQLTDSLEDKA